MPAARPSEAGWAPPAWRGVRAGPEALGWGAGGSAAPLLLSQMCSCRRRWEQEKPLRLNSVSCSAGVAEFPGVKCILLLLKPRSGSPQRSPFYLLQSSLLKGCATVALLGYTKKTQIGPAPEVLFTGENDGIHWVDRSPSVSFFTRKSTVSAWAILALLRAHPLLSNRTCNYEPFPETLRSLRRGHRLCLQYRKSSSKEGESQPSFPMD